MRVFVGYGYNEQDKWIEEHVFPILRCVGFTVLHGKDLHGQILQPGVEKRLDQSDAVIAFFTIRQGQGDADFTSHIWVRDELVYAVAKNKPVIPVRENGVKLPDGLLGNRQYIQLDQKDRLACVTELLIALGQREIRRVRPEPPRIRFARTCGNGETQPVRDSLSNPGYRGCGVSLQGWQARTCRPGVLSESRRCTE